MPRLRLLQFSDLHVASQGVTLRRWLTSSGVPFTAWDRNGLRLASQEALRIHHRAPVEGVILSGDLADTGCRNDLGLAKSVLGLAGEGRFRTLANMRTRMLVLPGNHDRFRGGKVLWVPGNQRFDQPDFFGGLWTGGLCGTQFWRFPDTETPDFVLIAADHCLPSVWHAPPRKHLGRGLVRTAQLKRLQQLTVQFQATGATVIWLVHFAPEFPFANRREGSNLRLMRGLRLLERAYLSNVSLILCGHTHRALRYAPAIPGVTSRGPEIICCGPACCQTTGSSFLEMTIDTDQHQRITQIDAQHWHKQLSQPFLSQPL